MITTIPPLNINIIIVIIQEQSTKTKENINNLLERKHNTAGETPFQQQLQLLIPGRQVKHSTNNSYKDRTA